VTFWGRCRSCADRFPLHTTHHREEPTR
jgi:hypothetical protein